MILTMHLIIALNFIKQKLIQLKTNEATDTVSFQYISLKPLEQVDRKLVRGQKT